MITALHETSAQNTAIQTITFKVGTCALGLVLVAATPQGICAILLGSDEKALVGQLRSIFPQAALQKDSRELGEVLNRVVQFIETPTATLALHLDIGGTAFQKRAWKALREIPAGQTTTYKELALMLSATPQEIGEACAANTLAVAVPCHQSFVTTETSPAIVGAWIASRHSWHGKGWRRDHNNSFHSGSHCRPRLGGDDKGLG